jgi:hypothetical protein
MNHACQSTSTLKEMLAQAARRVARSGSGSAHDLSKRIDELARSIEDGAVSSGIEHEIVSLCVIAELEDIRSRS